MRPWLVILLLIVLVAWLTPFVWTYLGSLKSQAENLIRPPTVLPQHPTLDNFTTWFTDLHFFTFFQNSVVVAIATVVANLIFCSMVGYALAKLRFPGRQAIFVTTMVTLMVPGVVTFIPLFVIVAKMGLLDTALGLVLPFMVTPLGVFLMRQFMQAIPDALLEAARIDGAGEFRLFFRIVLPLCGAPLATLAVITFLASWNNFLWPLVATQSESGYTLPVALSLFSTGQHSTDYGLLLAGSVLIITPILVLFLLLQRYFIRGIATTGIK
ncbi:MAG: carbohydrate ABC transporter permease [Protaetiibacter sp.]